MHQREADRGRDAGVQRGENSGTDGCASFLDVVDIKILVDDSSKDNTAGGFARLGIQTFVHEANFGYGRNQQTLLTARHWRPEQTLLVMLHPDYQYTPTLVPAMAGMIASGVYDMVLGSRFLGAGALKGGMPFYNMSRTAF